MLNFWQAWRSFRIFVYTLVFGLTSCLLLFFYIISAPAPLLLEGISFSPMIVDRQGEIMRLALTTDDKYRQYVPLEQIPEHMQQAVLLYEDQYFYHHPGVNPFALFRAVFNTVFQKQRMGASTIAMQVARLRYKIVTNTIDGKLKQMLLALQLIWHYGHNEVLEAYFNLAPYGGNIEGISAASRIYFGQSVESLTPYQSLALCLIPQNPQKRGFQNTGNNRLVEHPDLAEARKILHKNWNAVYPEKSVPENPPLLQVYSNKDLPMTAPHFTTELLQKIKNTPYDTKTLQSTIDSAQQTLLENSIQHYIEHNRLYGLKNASAMLLHWPSMEVRALVGSADFHNDFIHGQVDGTKAKRSPGSTLKPFIYALALDQGIIHPQTMLMDTPQHFAEYNPENFDKQFQGPLPAHEALRFSRNVPAINVASRLSPNLYDFLKRAHIDLEFGINHYGLSLVLGGAELSMRELVLLYAMLANGGIWQDLRFTKADNENNLAFSLLSPEAALATLYMLEYKEQTTSNKVTLPWRYKTGTSNGFRDAWSVGVFGPYILAVWVGNFDNSSNPMFIGNRVAVPLYKNIVKTLTWQEEVIDPLATKYQDTKLIQIDVCRDTGDVQTELCQEKIKTWFIPGRSPIQNSNIYRKIWIDEESGLRLCGPAENAKEVVWEFWPSELYHMFAIAGQNKTLPPAFAESCDQTAEEAWYNKKILIQSPKTGITYHLSENSENNLAFQASSTANATSLFWFVNQEYIGATKPNESLLWPMKIGTHTLYVMDDLGQNQSIDIEVQ